MTKYLGAYVSVLGGLDAFVFAARISENWLGVKPDEPANASGGSRISAPDSPVSVWVIPTNEELMIARHTLALIRP